jgi:predicted transcriptional regulator
MKVKTFRTDDKVALHIKRIATQLKISESKAIRTAIKLLSAELEGTNENR